MAPKSPKVPANKNDADDSVNKNDAELQNSDVKTAIMNNPSGEDGETKKQSIIQGEDGVVEERRSTVFRTSGVVYEEGTTSSSGEQFNGNQQAAESHTVTPKRAVSDEWKKMAQRIHVVQEVKRESARLEEIRNSRVTGHTGNISTAIIFYNRFW